MAVPNGRGEVGSARYGIMARRKSVPVAHTAEELLTLFLQLPVQEQDRFLQKLHCEEILALRDKLNQLSELHAEETVQERRRLQVFAQTVARQGAALRRTDEANVEKVRQAERIKQDSPHRKWRCIAKDVGLTESQLKTYRRRY